MNQPAHKYAKLGQMHVALILNVQPNRRRCGQVLRQNYRRAAQECKRRGQYACMAYWHKMSPPLRRLDQQARRSVSPRNILDEDRKYRLGRHCHALTICSTATHSQKIVRRFGMQPCAEKNRKYRSQGNSAQKQLVAVYFHQILNRIFY